ncbi:MAG: peptidoglycan DD-metalloendopeptidase family protein [Candidatus Doudnabacteria bacterium]|nr:peptidoglycan DD-metalloendopeptidase family protein [Candidatus Doudnabacteria bacterium]
MKLHRSYGSIGIPVAVLFAAALFVSPALGQTQDHDHSHEDEYPFGHEEADILEAAGGPENLEELNRRIGDQKERIEDIEGRQEQLEKDIETAKAEGATLRTHIAVLDGEIERTQLSIEKTGEEISQTDLEILKVEEEITIQESDIARSRKILGEFIRELYKSDQASTLEILLANESLSDFLDARHSTQVLEEETQLALTELNVLLEELQWQERVLETKQETLTQLKGRLDDEKAILDEEKSGKQSLLAVTEEQEANYEELLAQAQTEHRNAEAEISALESDIKKIIEQERNTNPDFNFVPGDGTLSWPINPIHGISAYFDDPDYIRFFGVPHGAIDVPTPQNTAIHAPADAYVVKYRNAGLGYSYILLSHGNGLTTLYGHVTGSYVTAGDTVKAGDVIGLTGGTPGTPGAGYRTTGPHLHFETRLNGTKVNPLNYLPSL